MSKRVLFISVTSIFILFALFLFVRPLGICGLGNITCNQFSDQVAETLFPIVPVFIFACITYFLPQEIFKTWLTFTLVFVPIIMLCTILAPEYSNSLLPVVKGSVTFVLSLVYTVCSVGVIVLRWFQMKKNESTK